MIAGLEDGFNGELFDNSSIGINNIIAAPSKIAAILGIIASYLNI